MENTIPKMEMVFLIGCSEQSADNKAFNAGVNKPQPRIEKMLLDGRD